MPLPETREEFEVRSSLFYILHELDEYLTIKKMFKPDPKRTHNVSGKRLTRDLNKKIKPGYIIPGFIWHPSLKKGCGSCKQAADY